MNGLFGPSVAQLGHRQLDLGVMNPPIASASWVSQRNLHLVSLPVGSKVSKPVGAHTAFSISNPYLN